MPKTVSVPRHSHKYINNINNPKKETKRYDHIDGLRGIAILLVVIFHLFVGKVSSGVDIFLFIGGLLFLSSHMKNAQKPEGITFFQSFIRIIRRLVPLLVLVILSTLISILIIIPSSNWERYFHDASSSMLYTMNYRLIDQSSDYQAAGSDATPFQHLWSMSVQMQIYIAILAIIFIIMKSFTFISQRYRKIVIVSIIAAMTIASFVYSTYMTLYGNQAVNYYSTLSRFWEIGIGSVIGLFFASIVIHPVLRWIFSISGLAIIISTGIFINGVEEFPGYMTLIPLLGAFLIIISGNRRRYDTEKSIGPVIWILESRPLLFIGSISYSLYLWHWPLMIMTLKATKDYDYPQWYAGVSVFIVSILIAWVTKKYVEDTLRQKAKPERGNVFSSQYIKKARRINPSVLYPVSAITIAIFFILISSSPMINQAYISASTYYAQKKVDEEGGIEGNYPGAKAFLNNATFDESLPVYPHSLNLETMMPPTTEDGCFSGFDNEDIVLTNKHGKPCFYGDKESERTMYVVGGSHSEEYMPALDEIGKRRNIRIVPIIKMGCPLYQNEKWNKDPYPGCAEEWSPKVEKFIIENPPTDGVFMISTRPHAIWGWGPEIVPDYYIETFDRIARAGVQIYAMRDNAWLVNNKGQLDARTCVHDNADYMKACGQEATMNISQENPALFAYQNIPNIKHLDISSSYIKDNWVNVVVGNVLVLRDSHHLTRQFVETLTDEIERQLSENPWTGPTRKEDVQNLILETPRFASIPKITGTPTQEYIPPEPDIEHTDTPDVKNRIDPIKPLGPDDLPDEELSPEEEIERLLDEIDIQQD